MSAALEMALLLLLFWATQVSPQVTSPRPTLETTSLILHSRNSVEHSTSSGVSTPPAPSTFRDNKVPSPGTSVGANTGPAVSEMMTSKEYSTKRPSEPLEISNATSGPAVPTANSQGTPNVTGGVMTFISLETSGGTNESSVTKTTSSLETSSEASGPTFTMATSSLESFNGTSGPLVTMAMSSPETSSGTSGPPVTMAMSSPETSSGTSGLPVTMATSSPETSSGTRGLPVTMATSSPEPSSGASGPPVTMAMSSPEPPSGASGRPVPMTVSSLVTSSGASSTPVSSMKVSTVTTLKPPPRASTNPMPSGGAGRGQAGSLLVPTLVALLVVAVLLALLLLWRRRQKQRTGMLTLSGGAKRNGLADAWAGPARVADEEAALAAEMGPGGAASSGAPEAEGSSLRPALTTFLSRRRSRQGALMMEELRAGPPHLQGEEEPLVGSDDEAAADAAPRGTSE